MPYDCVSQVSTKRNTYFMYASNEKEKDDWIGYIGRAIVQSSGTYIDNDDGDNSDDDYDFGL